MLSACCRNSKIFGDVLQRHTQNDPKLSDWAKNIPCNLVFFRPDESNCERLTAILHKMVLYCLLEGIMFDAIYISCRMNRILNVLQRSYTKWRYTVCLREEYSMQSSFSLPDKLKFARTRPFSLQYRIAIITNNM